MKIIRKKIYLIAILSGMVGLSACSHDDVLAPNDSTDNGTAIRFTTAINDFTGNNDFMGNNGADTPATRATVNDDGTGSFTNDDQTMIFISHQDSPELVSISAVFRNGTWEADGLSWNHFSDGAELNFHAFFPARTHMETLQVFTLPNDQSTPEQYAAADLLHASALRRVQGSGAVPLDFHHVMHRLTVNLSLSATPGTLTQADVDAATVVIKNMCLTGTIDHTGKVRTSNTPLSDFTPLKSTDGGNCFRTILFPQSVQGGASWIEITVGGKIVTYPVPVGLTQLEGGKEQVVNLKLAVSPASNGYAIGDYWPDSDNPEGIVFWVKPGSLGTQGKVVGLGETYVTKWGLDIDEQAAGVAGIRSVTDGATATKSMIAKYKSSGMFDADYPAFYYIYNTVNGNDDNGVWYLPARDELKMLYAGYSGKVYEGIADWEAGFMPDRDLPECVAARSAFNAKLIAKGGKAIGSSGNSVNWWYLSSSEIVQITSFSFSFEKGGYSYDPKSYDGNIRWIRDF
jgi:hypothetical protein